MVVPDDLILSFFKDASSKLLTMNVEDEMKALSLQGEDEKDGGYCRKEVLSVCRRHILDLQQGVLKQVVENYSTKQQRQHEHDSFTITMSQARKRLGGLSLEHHLSQELRQAMDGMNEAARLALCKLVLFTEESHFITKTTNTRTRTDLQTSGDLDRTNLLEYFGLCLSALKLHCVKKFMVHGGSLFEGLPPPTPLSSNPDQFLFPQTRLEYVQQLLAKSMGWDPEFLTSYLRRIFVEKDDSIELVHDHEVSTIFEQLVQQMGFTIRAASLEMSNLQHTQLLSDLDKGGNTRVVCVQYSEFEITPDGYQERSVSSPPGRQSTLDAQLTEEEQKSQIRLASEAAILQQEILGELLSMQEHERNDCLQEAKEVSEDVMKRALALSPGRDRIEFLRSVDPHTSRQLARHKLWTSMLHANGGKPPKMAPKCNAH
jgi:hypothetical protein